MSRWADRLRKEPMYASYKSLFAPKATPAEEWLEWALAPFGMRWRTIPPLREFIDCGPEAIPVLVGLLNDPDPNTCWAAATILEAMEPPPKEAVPALLSSLSRFVGDLDGDCGTELASRGDAARAIVEAIHVIDPHAMKNVHGENSRE